MNDFNLCIFGEVLFDHFPDGKSVLGGAPFNVAWHLQAFAQTPYFISRVGADAEGEWVRQAMREWGMEIGGLQTDPNRPTGRVDISFVGGEPVYNIVEACAYDAIAPPSAPVHCHLFYHGSLALRAPQSRLATQPFKAGRPSIVFLDVNLRAPWWHKSHVLQTVREADWVKLNLDEFNQLTDTSGEADTELRSFVAEYDLKGLVLTCGAQGAKFVSRAGHCLAVRPQPNLEVIDTVGAGDAFAAVTILGLLQDWPMDVTLTRAQAFASQLVCRRGATVRDPDFYQPFVRAWGL